MERSVSFHPAGVPFHILAKLFFFHFSSVDFTCVGNAGKDEKLVRAIPPEYKIRSVAAAVSCYRFIIVAAVIVLWLGGIVSVVCSIVLSQVIKPFL